MRNLDYQISQFILLPGVFLGSLQTFVPYLTSFFCKELHIQTILGSYQNLARSLFILAIGVTKMMLIKCQFERLITI